MNTIGRSRHETGRRLGTVAHVPRRIIVLVIGAYMPITSALLASSGHVAAYCCGISAAGFPSNALLCAHITYARFELFTKLSELASIILSYPSCVKTKTPK